MSQEGFTQNIINAVKNFFFRLGIFFRSIGNAFVVLFRGERTSKQNEHNQSNSQQQTSGIANPVDRTTTSADIKADVETRSIDTQTDITTHNAHETEAIQSDSSDSGHETDSDTEERSAAGKNHSTSKSHDSAYESDSKSKRNNAGDTMPSRRKRRLTRSARNAERSRTNSDAARTPPPPPPPVMGTGNITNQTRSNTGSATGGADHRNQNATINNTPAQYALHTQIRNGVQLRDASERKMNHSKSPRKGDRPLLDAAHEVIKQLRKNNGNSSDSDIGSDSEWSSIDGGSDSDSDSDSEYKSDECDYKDAVSRAGRPTTGNLSTTPQHTITTGTQQIPPTPAQTHPGTATTGTQSDLHSGQGGLVQNLKKKFEQSGF